MEVQGAKLCQKLLNCTQNQIPIRSNMPSLLWLLLSLHYTQNWIITSRTLLKDTLSSVTYWFPQVSWYVGRWWCDIFEWCTTRSELESITQRHTEWWLPPQWQCRELSEHTTTKSKSWEYWKQMYQYQNRFWFLLYLYFLMNINTNLFLVWITFAMINWFLFDTEFLILVYIWVNTCTKRLVP